MSTNWSVSLSPFRHARFVRVSEMKARPNYLKQAKRRAVMLLSLVMIGSVPSAAQPLTWEQAAISGQRFDEIEVWSFVRSSSGELYAAALNDGVFHSSDNGDNWVWIGLRDEEVLSVAAGADDRLFAGSLNGRGVLATQDNGLVWLSVGLDGMDIGALEVGPSGKIYATAGSGFPNVVYRSDDNGSAWTQASNGLDGGFIWRLHALGDDIVLAAASNGLYRSANAGVNWDRVAFADTSVLSFAATSQGAIYAGATIGVYRSTDDGQTWTEVWETGEDRAVLSLAVIPGGDIFAGLQLFGMSSGGVYRLTDNGVTWEMVGLGGTEVRAMTLDVHDRVVIGTTDSPVNGIFVERQPPLIVGLWELTTMSDANGPVDLAEFNAVFIEFWENGDARWIVDAVDEANDAELDATYSVQESTSLLVMNHLIPGVGTIPLTMSYSFSNEDEMLLSINQQNAVLINSLFGLSLEGAVSMTLVRSFVGIGAAGVVPSEIILSQNYPNPFNPTTTISFDLPRLSEATLTVYDVLGRQVKELASGKQRAGTYEVSFDATGLPSGIFFYRLTAGDYVETKRMVVVK